MIVSSLIRKRKISQMTTRCHSLSFVVTRCTTHCHSLSFAFTRCTTRCHSLSLEYHSSVFYKRFFFATLVLKFVALSLFVTLYDKSSKMPKESMCNLLVSFFLINTVIRKNLNNIQVLTVYCLKTYQAKKIIRKYSLYIFLLAKF